MVVNILHIHDALQGALAQTFDSEASLVCLYSHASTLLSDFIQCGCITHINPFIWFEVI